MVQLIQDGFFRFAYETGIITELWRYEPMGFGALVLTGVTACFFGIRVYRGYCAALLFFLVSTVTCILLRERVSWRAVVTCFSVVGLALAFFALFWNRLDACAFCALIGGCVGWILFHSLWGIVLPAAFCLGVTLIFPMESLRTLTAVSGCWILWDLSVLRGRETSWPSMIPLGAVGYFIQWFLSRNQTLFKKVRPDRLTHWLEERERKKQDAHSVSKGN